MSAAASLRPGTELDLDAVLLLASVSSEAPQWSRAVYEEIVQAAQLDTERALQRVLIVAESGAADGCMIDGFAVAAVAQQEAELESVVVAAGMQRKGIGKRLCLAVMDWSRRKDAAQMRLEVRASNAGARSLYRGLGFVEVGLRREYYRSPPEDAIQMALHLTAADL